ncbi:MAG: hypothetical protein A2234_02345 [Elusimicrobia bacterium RIFOXYA2_FULL_58_8]|nr:MAG: hypothetical protein A2285_02310 [Elusimicrobia bacterium RIFOXYA12_FULL_57_11]OGS13153.1 MAG: hypothetical protein A2234_02345 [Elusimicrobia bacterium RIFOXYA2_FULL_58_8]
MKMHPLFMLMVVLGIVTGMYSIYGMFPISMPVIFVGSLAGFFIRLNQFLQERKKQTDATAAIDFARLRATRFEPYAGWIKENVRGHDPATDHAVSHIQQGLAVAAPGQVLGAFMLAGPTGTGKTFLAEMVAKALYKDSEPVLLSMSQYKSPQDVFTLIGPPPGYQGYEIGGSLTRPVLENPYRVIILDEFEKAHLDVQHCFYDILDNAQCQEKSSGKKVHFGACVFFATCNSGVDALRSIWSATSDPALRTGRAREAMAREGFERPLLARFTDIFLMDQLKPVEIAEVACLQIAKHWRQYGIEVSYTSPEVLVEAIRRNIEFQDYGVRQLAGLIREITTPSIEEARRTGATRVRLELDKKTGAVTVSL